MAGKSKEKFVVLLRGINVGGHNKIPMAELRALAEEQGLLEVQTYIASGNLLCRSSLAAGTIERRMEKAIEKRLGFFVTVVVRSDAEWFELAEGSPFPEAEAERSNLLHVGLAKGEIAADAAESLGRFLTNGECVETFGRGVWIDYPNGAGRSKVTPKALDSSFGTPITSRNWRTVLKIAELLRAGD